MRSLVALMSAVVVLVAVSSANGAKPLWSVKPTKLNFGAVSVGGQGVQTVTVTNTSSVTEQVAGAHVMTGDQADFAVQGSSSCTPGIFLAAGGSCTVLVAFNPQSTGTFKAGVQIDLNPGPPVTVSVSGRGT
jgi:hypothetical protein